MDENEKSTLSEEKRILVPKSLVITEKPSVGRDIAAILHANEKRNGYYEGTYYIVTWAVGHLFGFCYPNDYKEEWVKWDLNVLPMIPVKWETKPIPGLEQQLKVIQSLFARKDVSLIINAGDSGQEGELIQRHIYNKLNKRKIPVKRLWTSSLTNEAVLSGLKVMKDSKEYDNLYYAGLARAMSDWLIGINLTRLFTCIYGAKPPLSAGRVQSPTLSLIVFRHQAIVNFKPENYFILSITAGGIDASWFKETENANLKNFKTLEEARFIEGKVKGQQAKVVLYTKEQKRESRPQLHNLSTLQQEASAIFKYSINETLAAAQSLYEKKLSTYPRTDSCYITDDMVPEMERLMQYVAKNVVYSNVAQYILSQGLNLDHRIVDGSKVVDHPALLPTNNIAKVDLSKLSKVELNVYHLIISRFLIAMCRDYIYNLSTVVLVVNGETFKATGRAPVKKGYKSIKEALFSSIHNEGSNSKRKSENQLENAPEDLAEGNIYLVDETNVEKKKTKPPVEYTDGTLAAKMENPFANIEIEGDEKEIKESLAGRGLGTVATRASIIEDLIKKNYIYRDKSYLIPTKRGITMVENVLPDILKQPDMTAEWEYRLKQISKGTYSPQVFIDEVKRILFETIQTEKAKGGINIKFEQKDNAPAIGKCPICGDGDVSKHVYQKGEAKQNYFSCSNNKKEGGTCNFILWETDAYVKKITKEGLKESSVKTIIKSKTRRFKTVGIKANGEKYDCYLVFESCSNGRANWKMEFPPRKRKAQDETPIITDNQ